jgi:hypothetical protein
MQRVENIREQAGECLRLADIAQSSEQRMLLISMAHAWLSLADQTERLMAPQSEGQQAPRD